MDKFVKFSGVVAPLDRPNVDTDAIIPKQYLKSIKRSGFGPNLFDDWRYLDPGEPGQDVSGRRVNEEFVLNLPRYANTQIMLGRDNFGCGSSREHAVWAFMDYGIKVIIAPSYADIFYNNSYNNGMLPIILSETVIDELFKEVEAADSYELDVDLESLLITTPSGREIAFECEAFRRHRLLNGLDDIGLTLQHADDIKAYEEKRKAQAPWLF